MSTVTSYSLAIFLVGFGGGVLPLLANPGEKFLKFFVSFGAGVLIGISAIHMIPEAAIASPSNFGVSFLFGFLALYFLERFVMIHACEEHDCDYHTIGLAAFSGLAVHGLIEGAALGSSITSSAIADKIFLGVVAHKAPAAIALCSILQLAKKPRWMIALFVAGVAASTPAGILCASSFLQDPSHQRFFGPMLSAAAGTFVYIATCDILPEMHRNSEHRITRLAWFCLGIATAFLGGHD